MSGHRLVHDPMESVQHSPVRGTSCDKTPSQTATDTSSRTEGDDGMESGWQNEVSQTAGSAAVRCEIRNMERTLQAPARRVVPRPEVTADVDVEEVTRKRAKTEARRKFRIVTSTILAANTFRLVLDIEADKPEQAEREIAAAFETLEVHSSSKESVDVSITKPKGLCRTCPECRFRDDVIVPEESARAEPSYTVSGADDYSISKQQSETSPDFSKLKTFADLIARNAEVDANEREEAKPEKAISDPPREVQYIQHDWIEHLNREPVPEKNERSHVETLEASYTSELEKMISATYKSVKSLKREVNQLKENLTQHFKEINRTVENFIQRPNVHKRLPKAISRIIDICNGDLGKLLLKTGEILGNLGNIELEFSARGFLQNCTSFIHQPVDSLQKLSPFPRIPNSSALALWEGHQ